MACQGREAAQGGLSRPQSLCCDQAKWVLGLAPCKHAQQREMYLFLVKRQLSAVRVINHLSAVAIMGLGCRICRELNYALAGEEGAHETWIYIHGVSACGVCVKPKDMTTSAKINQKTWCSLSYRSTSVISIFNQLFRQIQVFFDSFKMFYVFEMLPTSTVFC